MLFQMEGTAFAKSLSRGRAVSCIAGCGGSSGKGPVESDSGAVLSYTYL